jgi:hypothetical protein
MPFELQPSHPNVVYKIDGADWALSGPARAAISRGLL